MNARLIASIVCVATLVTACGAGAQSPADFYRGKEMHIVVGSGVGGGYDVYSRALARHWGRHIPGNPAIVVQNMPGAEIGRAHV